MAENKHRPMPRREFLKWSAGLLTSMCLGKRPGALAASPYHPVGSHRLMPLPAILQRNIKNPYLRMPIRQMRPFDYTLSDSKIPGIDYITGDEPVRAVAAGIVHFVGQRRRGDRWDGWYVRVAHDIFDDLKKAAYPRVTLYRYQAFRSTYYHLSTAKVRHWQTVQRGQVIGRGARTDAVREDTFKLVLEERGNFVNPDDYGIRHGFMTYWDESRNLEIPLQEMHRRLEQQNQVVEKFMTEDAEGENGLHLNAIHGHVVTEKFTDYPVTWSTVERFRYLEYLYRKNPDRFKSLAPSELAQMKQRFEDHQPITLTLPFR